MTLKEIQKIIKDFEGSELTELELEYEDVKLRLSKNKTTNQTNLNNVKNNVETTLNNETIEPTINLPVNEIKSPLVGTFYAASSPESDPYVKVGERVKKGDVVCIIEAMKIMNEITATTDGIIENIHFDNGEAVGYNDVIFTVKSDGNNTK